MDQDTVSLRDYLAVLNRRRLLVLLTTVLVTVGALAWSLMQTPVYESGAQVLLDPLRRTEEVSFSESGLKAAISTEPIVMMSRPVLERVADEIGGSLGRLRGQTRVEEVGSDSRVVQIVASDTDPERAALVANTIAAAYLDHRREVMVDDVVGARETLDERAAELREQISALQDEISAEQDAIRERLSEAYEPRIAAAGEVEAQRLREELETQIAITARTELALPEAERDGLRAAFSRIVELGAEFQDPAQAITGGGQVIRPAEISGSPVSPQPVRTAQLAALLGLLLGVALAFVRDHLDDRVRDDDDVRRASGGRPLLGRVPHWPGAGQAGEERLVTLIEPYSPVAEAYRVVATNVRFLLAVGGVESGSGRVVMFSSPTAEDGKTSTAANVAVVAARSGQRVLLVDSDLRRPSIAPRFGIIGGPGLSEVLLEGGGPDTYLREVGVDNLLVLPAGTPPPNPTELLGSPPMAALIAELRKRFDLIVLDSPPVLAVADALELGRLSDLVVLTIQAREARRRQVSSALESFETAQVDVGGAVLNDLPIRLGDPYTDAHLRVASAGEGASPGLGGSSRPKLREVGRKQDEPVA